MDDANSRHLNSYALLLMMVVLSFISMYILMYAMVDTLGHVYNNFNQVYMAGLMTAPMIVIELILMRSMYSNQQRNIVLIVLAVAAWRYSGFSSVSKQRSGIVSFCDR